MLIWWSSLSRVGKAAGIIGTLCGSIVGTAGAWPIIEWGVPALRGYARSYTDDKIEPLHQQLVQLKLDRNHDRRERLLGEIEKRELELQSDQVKQLPQYRDLVQQRVDRVKRELKEIENDDSSLFKQKLAK